MTVCWLCEGGLCDGRWSEKPLFIPMIATGRIKSITTATAFLVLLAGRLEGQSERILYANAAQLNIHLALDQTTYFPGEAASLTITVTNPTSNALQVPEPF